MSFFMMRSAIRLCHCKLSIKEEERKFIFMKNNIHRYVPHLFKQEFPENYQCSKKKLLTIKNHSIYKRLRNAINTT